MNDKTTHRSTDGLLPAFAAFGIWGVLPLYIGALRGVPATELVGWRIACTVPVCLLFLALRGRLADLKTALRNRRVMTALGLSSLLIAMNWIVYIIAVHEGHVLAASLGYYINPLVNVLGGTLLFRERLSRLQWLAVAIATIGVSLLAWGALDMLWISVALALSFGAYGIVRKIAPVEALPGLTIESLILAPPSLAVLAFYAATPAGSSMSGDVGTGLLLACSGVITAVPLLLFTVAARRLDLSVLGFIQFTAPTAQFLLGLTVFGERLRPVQLACFMLIWLAVAIFCWDLFRRRPQVESKAPVS